MAFRDTVKINLGQLSSSDREAVRSHAEKKNLPLDEAILDLAKQGLSPEFINNNSGNISGPALQVGHYQGNITL